MSEEELKKPLRLKQIRAVGFKSFAEKVVLDFHEGITGIVGPNGCGKSNISDAFRWVLGETSAKQLRGKKMEDIIFSGTASRKPLNFAEVTLVLDNSSGQLPVDYTEVEVTRRYHRDGDSEFLINKKPVRMRDLQDLFLDSGVGKSSFSIFEQGKIDEIIQKSPLERRYIFEEAANILRFLQRKREALNKMERTNENISRLKDIHKEVEKRISVLEKQVQNAQEYKEKKERTENWDKALHVAKWDLLQEKLGRLRGQIAEAEAKTASGEEAVGALSRELKEGKAELSEKEELLRRSSEEVYKTRSEKEIKVREQQTTQERLDEAAKKVARWKEELSSLCEKRKERKGEEAVIGKELSKLEKEVARQKKLVDEKQAKVKELEEAVSRFYDEQHKLQQKRVQHLQAENRAESELKQDHVRLESSEERKEQILKRAEEIGAARGKVQKQVAEKQKEAESFLTDLERRKKALAALEEKHRTLTGEIEERQKEREALEREYAEAETREKVLCRLREEMEGVSPGSKRLLKSALGKKLKGLYEYFGGEREKESALAAVMRPYGDTLVVEKEKELEEVLAFAKKEKIKDFSLLCLEMLKGLNGGKKEGVEEYFSRGLLTAKGQEQALSLVKKSPGSPVWIEDGGLIDGKGVIFYMAQGEGNVFAREAEIKALGKQKKSLNEELQRRQRQMEKLQEKRGALQAERLEADQAVRKAEMAHVEAGFVLQRFEGDLKRMEQEEQKISEERKLLEETVGNLKMAIRSLEKSHKETKKAAAQAEGELLKLNLQIEKRNALFKTEQEQFLEIQRLYLQKAEELRQQTHRLQVIEVQQRESELQEKRLEEEIAASGDLQSRFKQRSSAFNKELSDVEKALSTALSGCTGLEKDVNRRRQEVEKLEERIAKENGTVKKAEHELGQLNVKAAQNESACEALKEDLQERYQIGIDDARALEIKLPKPVEEMEKIVKAERKELEKASSRVNMTSIEEYEENKGRYAFYNSQLDDLSGSKEELVAIIAKLDEQSRKLFKATFEVIRANFQKNFKILFNGGEADLTFTGEGDVLEAGIDIVARPPGKQMRSISLLSGGEKCLTAMALLFAIFEVKPAPFSVLDEIDAPLDDSNVDRFVNVVKQFTEQSQFIIITHNKRTMGICDRLYGVSMQERGVSKLLSMEFSREEAEVPVSAT